MLLLELQLIISFRICGFIFHIFARQIWLFASCMKQRSIFKDWKRVANCNLCRDKDIGLMIVLLPIVLIIMTYIFPFFSVNTLVDLSRYEVLAVEIANTEPCYSSYLEHFTSLVLASSCRTCMIHLAVTVVSAIYMWNFCCNLAIYMAVCGKCL